MCKKCEEKNIQKIFCCVCGEYKWPHDIHHSDGKFYICYSCRNSEEDEFVGV